MIQNNDVTELLSRYENTGKTRGIFLIARLIKAKLQLRKIVKKGLAVSHENCRINEWLYDNFSKLEECIVNEISRIRRMGKVQACSRYPRHFKVMYAVVQHQNFAGEEAVISLYSMLNNAEKNLDLTSSKSLGVLLESAVSLSICDCFIKLCDNEDLQRQEQKIARLFGLLDTCLSLPEEEPVLSNAVEKLLCSEKMGLYENLSNDTKQSYRKNLIRLAKKSHQTQLQTAEKILADCDEKTHIGTLLSDKAYGGRQYICLHVFLSTVFTVSLCFISLYFLIACIPVYYVTGIILSRFFNRFVVKEYTLPRIELDVVPDDFGVMTVITTLLLGGNADEAVFKRLERSYLSCGGKNTYFALLCDLCDSDEQMTASDEAIFENARDSILHLRKKYGDVFYLFLRQREYNEGEDKYIAPERKRGAVCSLCSFLCGKSDDFCHGSIKPSSDACKNIRYILTLDADTNLSFDCIRTLVGIMSHPQNMPVFDEQKHVVTSGYGMLQPATSTTLDSAGYSFFTKVMCGFGGIDNYNGGGSDKNMSLFGRSFFCGKGMIDKNVFYKAFCTPKGLRENTILSHDSIEGAILRCAFVPYVTFTDSYPKEELSYYKRLHRWTRGDVQNTGFLLNSRKTLNGRKIPNKIGVFSKCMLLQNLVNAIVPIFSLVLIFLSCTLLKRWQTLSLTVALSTLILPFIDSVLSLPKLSLWQNFRRLFYSKYIYSGLWLSLLQALFSLFALPKTALVRADAFIRSLYRCAISKKHRLEWTTAAQNDSEKNDGLLGYVKKNLVCALLGALLFLISDNSLIRLISIMWLAMPVLSYRVSRHIKKTHVLTKQQQDVLKKYCTDMWRFFDENVSDETNHLPADNVTDTGKLCSITSPTNIGLYLVCICFARKMGFIDTKELENRLDTTLSAIENLPKYRGVLYNWYNVKDMSLPSPKYLSSVDMGNFLCCVICTIGGVKEFGDEMKNEADIVTRLEKLLDCDIGFLYDKRQNLFRIGADDRNGEIILDKNKYDMLMSEARLLSFVSVAKKWVPVKHLSHLSRRLVEGNGYVGLASWSGTAFEYFMPELFVKSKQGSLGYEAMCFCYDAAKKACVNTDKGRVFGISESCYNQIDEDGNYKYYAFGTAKTALKSFDEKKVISPYSSFLFLNMCCEENLKNLSNLKGLGGYGKYGFYESVDFEHKEKSVDYAVVKTFMSHHIGMSMCACANELFSGVIRRWFSENDSINAALELWEEKIPFDTRVKKISRKRYLPIEKTHACAEQDIVKACDEDGKIEDKACEESSIICGNTAASFVTKSSIGTLFDIRENRELTTCEKILSLTGADLCKNAESFEIHDGAAVYSSKDYIATVFAAQNRCAKIIDVKSNKNTSLLFSCSDSFNDAEIGSGLVFSTAKNNGESLFGYGFYISSDGTVIGGDYEMSKSVKICFDENKCSEGEYVFCIWLSKDMESAVKYSRMLMRDFMQMKKSAAGFNRSLNINLNQIPPRLLCVLKQHFAFPKEMKITKVFVNESLDERIFNVILSLFTSHGCKREDILRLFEGKDDTCKQSFLVCIAFCLYITMTKDMFFADEITDGKPLYRLCLERLFFALKNSKNDKQLFSLARITLEIFAETSAFLSDGRMSQKLCDMALELDK